MGAERSGTDLSEHVFPIVALVIGVAVAALVAAMPQASLDVLMWRLWLPHVIPAAAPPVGVTGRTLLAVAALVPFALVALVAWRLRDRKRPSAPLATERAPTIRRADAHPDAPPRRPIRAEEDLGPPLPIITIAPSRGVPEPEQPLPVDLDQRMASFDPIAIPDVPRAPVRAVPPLATIVVPARGDDMPDTGLAEEEEAPVLDFLAEAPEEPTPIAEPAASIADPLVGRPVEPDLRSEPPLPEQVAGPPARPAIEPATSAQSSSVDEQSQHSAPESAGAATLAGLLDRLERGAKRRKAPATPAQPAEPESEPSLDDTLVMLRRMARS